MQTIKRILLWLRKLNLFYDYKEDEITNERLLHDQLLTTRIYLGLLGVSFCVLVLFTSLITRTISVKVQNPPFATFYQLQARYPDTLWCPCQEIAVPHDNFLSIQITYHQVCSSDLVSSEWIASLYNAETTSISPLDFRLTATIQFRLLRTMCSVMKQILEGARAVFLSGRFINEQALTLAAFDNQADILINQFQVFKTKTFEPFEATEHAMIAIRQTRLHSALHTNSFHGINPDPYYFYEQNNFYPRYDNATFDNEPKKNFVFCTSFNTAIYKAGIYAWGAEPRTIPHLMEPNPPPIFVIPGMHVGCMPYDALIASNLECFFNSTCLNITAQLISNLPSSAWPKPLDSSLLSQYSPNETIGNIYREFMSEKWEINKNFSGYYSGCAPNECTYTYLERFNIIYVITTLIGLYGGLSIALRIASPLIIKVGHYIHQKIIKKFQQRRHQPSLQGGEVNTFNPAHLTVSTLTHQKTSRELAQVVSESYRTKAKKMVALIKARVLSLNLFEDELNDVRIGLHATRAYLVLLATAIAVLIFYTSITVYVRSVKISNPSIDDFEHLYSTVKGALVCPCSNIGIHYGEIFTLSVARYHQICTSDFLLRSNAWQFGFFTIRFPNGSEQYSLSPNDFRTHGMTIFTQIGNICLFIQRYVPRIINSFLTEEFTSILAFSRDEFQERAGPMIPELITNGERDGLKILTLSSTAMFACGTESGMRYQTFQVNDKWITRQYSPAPSALNECSCSVAFNCPDPLWSGGQFICERGDNCVAGTVVWAIPGLVKACMTLEMMLASDLRCFYNQTCIDTLLSMYNVDLPDRLPLPAATLAIRPLNSSAPSRFLPNDTVRKMMDRALIDEWKPSINYNGYYAVCAPAACTYTVSERLNIIYIVTTIIGVFGGLTVTLRLLIPFIVYLIHLIISICRERSAEENRGKSQCCLF